MTQCLTYDDIQIIPSYSEVLRRADISLKTRFTRNTYIGIPLVSSPMDTITEYEMARGMIKLGGVGIIHRFMSIDQQAIIASRLSTTPKCGAVGVTGMYLARAKRLLYSGCNVLLIDVAHGDHILVKTALKKLKKEFKNVDIIAGSVATKSGAEHLCDWGADAIRVGIGNGCFTPSMIVHTENGNKLIKDIVVGDKVISHDGTINEVINTIEYDRDEEIMIINNIECTKNHEFYVLHKKYEHIVTENNIQDYAEWISAENLTKEYLLIDVT